MVWKIYKKFDSLFGWRNINLLFSEYLVDVNVFFWFFNRSFNRDFFSFGKFVMLLALSSRCDSGIFIWGSFVLGMFLRLMFVVGFC